MSNAPDVPAWAKDAIFYQIFPDRFAKSGRVTKPNNLLPWDAPPHQEKYHGGDLLGVVEKLDYLVDLGVNALYLNPIFQSACNHRYHTHDYYQVDPLLGGNAAFRELVTEAHKRGIRVMLDGVFNHASRGFFQFNDILENGPHSPWIDWFTIEDWPLSAYDGSKPAHYLAWWDNRALPKFNTDNPQVQEFLMQVAEFWVREYDIDGWRLDVAAEIETPGFWEEFRQRVRAIKPDAYIVGEIWGIAPEWLSGDRFDSNMNYTFTGAITAFAGQEHVSPKLAEGRGYQPYPPITAEQFRDKIDHLLSSFHWETNLVQYNQLDSHDTPRLRSLAMGDVDTLKLCTLFQMTYPGPPSIYYGNEIGIAGTDVYDEPTQDKDARWPMSWDESAWETDLLDYFKTMIRIRNDNPVFRHGRYETLFAEGNIYVFMRQDEEKKNTAVVALNVSNEPTQVTVSVPLDNGATLRPLYGTPAPAITAGKTTLTIPARDGAIYII